MHKNTSVQTLVLAVLVITLSVLSFTGCDLLTRESISVQGVWRLVGTFGDEKWEISDQEISYYSKDLDESWAPVGEYILRYRADVITYDNDQLNGGDTQFITGNTPAVAGYAVIRYTEVVAGVDTSNGEVGRFNVFRWAVSAGDAQKRDFTQGASTAVPGGPRTMICLISTRQQKLRTGRRWLKGILTLPVPVLLPSWRSDRG